MRRRPITFAFVFGALAVLPALPAAHAQGGPRLSAEVGIGGRYRPGGWVPITVAVVNTTPETLSGQVQITQADAGGASGGAVFARPVAIAPGPTTQYVQVCERGLDPGSQNVSAAWVDGEARGDGATQAQITSQSGGSRNAFSGVPVSPGDLLLVGLSADPAAITRLTGQQWGLMHTAGGVTSAKSVLIGPGGSLVQPGTNFATAQAAAATPDDLPDRPSGYDGVDAVLLRADAPLDALTEAQTDALKAWVASGGHLVVCGGPTTTPYDDPFYDGLLPAAIAPSPLNSVGGALLLTPKPLPGVRVVSATGTRPSIVTGPYGAGEVTLLATDPTQTPHAPWGLILGGTSSLLGVAVAQEANNRYFYSGGGQMPDAVLRAPSLDAPGANIVGLFLIGYVLVLVPLNYLILKRLDRKEWSWVTIPALVIVFAATTYGVGDAAKGNNVFVNRAAIVETTAGQSEAGVYAAVGLFSPRRTSYDLTVSDPEASVSDPMTQTARFPYNTPQADPEPVGQARFVQGSGAAAVQDAGVNMWAMRAFDTQTVMNLGGTFTATLAHSRTTGMVAGTLTNGTAHGLTDCRLFLNGSWQPLADLPSGATVTVTGLFPMTTTSGVPPVWGPMGDATDLPSGSGDVRQRMKSGLESFVGSLGGSDQERYYFGGRFEPPVAFQPRPGEAILVGFCDDPSLAGPSVRVDGQRVTQNAVTCVVIHVPLH